MTSFLFLPISSKMRWYSALNSPHIQSQINRHKENNRWTFLFQHLHLITNSKLESQREFHFIIAMISLALLSMVSSLVSLAMGVIVFAWAELGRTVALVATSSLFLPFMVVGYVDIVYRCTLRCGQKRFRGPTRRCTTSTSDTLESPRMLTPAGGLTRSEIGIVNPSPHDPRLTVENNV